MKIRILSSSIKPNAGYLTKGLKVSNVKYLHDKGFTGKGVRIGVIDSGCDMNHTFIKPNIIAGADFLVNVRGTYYEASRPVENTTTQIMSGGNPIVCMRGKGNTSIVKNEEVDLEFSDEMIKGLNDGHFHGTHCSGLVVQAAPDCELVVARALGSDGNGSYAAILNAFKYCVNKKCNIISMSLGGTIDSDALHKAIQDAVNNGIMVVTSAGNEGDGNANTDETSYPANYWEVINVGSLNADLTPADYSNTSRYVDVCAVGTNVVSCYPGNKWATATGTSQATPQVSGILACLRQKFIHDNGRAPTENELYQELLKNTIDLGYDKRIQGEGYVKITED